MRRRGLAVVVATMAIGGAERQAFQLARGLREREAESVHLLGLTGDGPLGGWCDRVGLPWRALLASQPVTSAFLVRAAVALVGALRRLDVEVVLPFTHLPNVLCGLVHRWGGARASVWNQRDLGVGRFRGRLGRRLERQAIARTERFVANSSASRSYLVDELGAPPGAVSIVPNAVAPPPALADRATWRGRLGAADGDLVVTMVANLSRLKDHDTLLRAWQLCVRRLATRGCKPILVLAGAPADAAAELTAVAASLGIAGQVRFAGFVEDVGGLLAASDLGVFSSRGEGSPNGVLECMAAGLAVVATRAPGVVDALGDVPEDCLAAPGDAVALAGAIERLASDEGRRFELGAANRRRAQAAFDPSLTLDRMAALIRG